jgi:hypothetical protein
MKVFNSSGVDVIGGTQSQAVLTAMPRDPSTMSTTDLANFCPNHKRDLVSGVISREDSTTTMAMTEHFGSKMALSRTNMMGNLVKRTWDDSIGTRRTTAGASLGPTADKTFTLGGTPIVSTTYLTTNTALILSDTNNLSDANNPLTFATYNIDFSAYIQVKDAAAADAKMDIHATLIAYDAAGNIVAEAAVIDKVSVVQTGIIDRYDVTYRGSLASTTKPIHRVILGLSHNNSPDNASTIVEVAESVFKVSGYEETSDLAARPIQVCVLEGLNASATLNINNYAVLTGVPDSTNTFISAGDTTSDVYDDNAVEIFLKSITRVMPRAFTTIGHGAVTRSLSAMYGDESMEISFKAMSFGDFSRAVQKLTGAAKSTGKDIMKVMEEMEPMIRSSGKVMSALPGPAGYVGSAMVSGSDLFRSR